MGPSKWSNAIGAMKDKTSISLAKKTGSTYLSDLKVAIVKATRHEEYAPDERYALEIISLTTYKQAYVNSCFTTIAKRLYKTRNWVVALKSLMLVHRLLNEGNLAFDQEIFFASRRGTRLLDMSRFTDKTGRSNAWDYTAFVKTYAAYLDERLQYRIKRRREKMSEAEEDERASDMGDPTSAMVLRDTPVGELKNEVIFSRAHHLMKLLEKFLACKPAGVARNNNVVAVALYSVVKDSFPLCNEITDITGVLIDRFMDLEIPDMVKVHEVFSRVSNLYDELDVFYSWCQTNGVARASEYPEVEKITQKKLNTMYEYIQEKAGMLQKKKTMSDPTPIEETQEKEKETEAGEDMNATKALPPPEGLVEETKTKDEETKKTQEVGDLLDLSEDTPSIEDHGDILALALFDGIPATNTQTSTIAPWETFKDSTGDWETALLQSVSHFTNPNASLPKGSDALMLDGMYKQGISPGFAASTGFVANGSNSNVAYGLPTGQPVLGLLAPPVAPSGTASLPRTYDPFAASVGLAPPTYVQMSDMEKRQSLYAQEQMHWQQYVGMQGNAQFASVHYQNPYQYNTGGFTRSYQSFY